VSRPRHLTTFGSLASSLVAVGALALPAGAAAQTRTVETASAGDVTAELSYVKRTRGSGGIRFEEFRDFRVKVLRGGQVLYDKPIGKPCEQFCTPTQSALTRKHVGLRDLNGDGEPEAIVDLCTAAAAAVPSSTHSATTPRRTCTAGRGSTPAAGSWRGITATTV